MIVKEIFYGVKCNRCGEMNETGDYTYMSDESSAENEALDNEWFIDNGKHYCPNCFTVNDETDEKTVNPPIPDIVKKIEKFLIYITKNIPSTIETNDCFKISFNEYRPVGIAEENWLASLPNVSFERTAIPESRYSKIVITIKS